MRSYGQIWQKIVCEENLLAAWRNVRRRRGHSQPVIDFAKDLEVNLESIRHDLVTGAYRHGDYGQFGILDPKPRTISCAQVRDRVVHHAFCNLVAPLLERSMSPRSFACRTGYGSHRALALVRDLAHSPAEKPRYFLKLDIRHYFDSIDHATLLGLLDPRFREREVQALAHEIVTHPFPGQAAGKGLPIGNLTSQWFANFYLNAFDHLAETGFGCGQVDYVRYMDDMVFLADDKPTLWRVKAAAERWLREERGLTLKTEATRLAPVTEGIPFLGLRIFGDHWRLQRTRFLRSTRCVRARLEAFAAGEIDETALRNSLVSSEGAVRWFGFRNIFASCGEAVGSQVGSRVPRDRARTAGTRDACPYRIVSVMRAPEGEKGTGSNRINRGGSYNNDASNCSSVSSNNNDPSNANDNIGFRLIITGRQGAQRGSHSGTGPRALARVSRPDGRKTEHVGAILPVGRFTTAQRGRARLKFKV